MGAINVITQNEKLFTDHQKAAEMFAVQLDDHKDCENLIVLGIPRGEVILTDKLARNLSAELGIVLTHKIRSPYQPVLYALRTSR